MRITLLFHDRLLHIANTNASIGAKAGMIWKLINDWNITFRVYPNFYHLIPAVYTIWTGFAPLRVVLSNVLYFAILIWSIYRIGTACQSRLTGLLAATLVSFFPEIYGVSTKWTPDFPCISFVALSLCFLFQCDFFRSRKYSLLFGLCAGLGMLFKFQAVIFIIGPSAYVMGKTLWEMVSDEPETKSKRGGVAVNICSSLFLWIVLAGIFAFPNFSALLELSHRELMPFDIRSRWYHPWYTLAGLTFYPLFLIFAVSVPVFFAMVLLFIPFLRSGFKFKTILALWFLVPYIYLTYNPIKVILHFSPALPIVALVIASGCSTISKRWLRRTVPTVLISLSLSLYFHHAFGMQWVPEIHIKPPIQPPDDGCESWLTSHPPFNYNFDECSKWLISKLGDAGYDPSYSHLIFIEESLDKHRLITDDLIAFYTTLLNRNIHFAFSAIDYELFMRWLQSSDFIIITTYNRMHFDSIKGAQDIYSKEWNVKRANEIIGSHAKLIEMIHRLSAYTIVGETTIQPFNMNMFLLKKPPHKLEGELTIDATDFHRGNVWVHFPEIGNDKGLEPTLTGHQGDIKFPDDRYLGKHDEESRFAEYDLAMPSEGRWSIQFEYACPLDSELNLAIINGGEPHKILFPATGSFSTKSRRWTVHAAINIPRGRSTLKIWSSTPWPRLSSIKFLPEQTGLP